jgi:DNA-binding XRE family transcriptional regulator
MSDYSHPLGDIVNQARIRLKLTQYEVAELIGVDSRTILNI